MIPTRANAMTPRASVTSTRENPLRPPVCLVRPGRNPPGKGGLIRCKICDVELRTAGISRHGDDFEGETFRLLLPGPGFGS